MMQYSTVQEALRGLWASYWDVRARDPEEAARLKAAIVRVTYVIQETAREGKALEERNAETERLLVEAIAKTRK